MEGQIVVKDQLRNVDKINPEFQFILKFGKSIYYE